MWKIYQTDTTDVTGNCIQAAVASLLELELEEAPCFEPTNYLVDLIKFFNSHGYQVMPGVRLDSEYGKELIEAAAVILHPLYCLLGVRSFAHPRVDHCVVGRWDRWGRRAFVAHDPNWDNQKRLANEYVIKDVDIIIPCHKAMETPLYRLRDRP